jgi:lipoprotein-anchoring transpeptidase ErfK/SrfK
MRRNLSIVAAMAAVLAHGPAAAEPTLATAAAAAAAAEATPAAAPAEPAKAPETITNGAADKPAAGETAGPASPAAAAAEPAPAAKPAPPPPPATTLKVAVDLTSQRLTVTEHGKIKHSWPISSGVAGFRTPTGNYRPQWAAKMWYSKKYDDAPMPHSVFFHDGFAIHATYATGRLGRPASHGCVRLSPANAETFYKLVHKHGYVHTRISIKGTPRDSAPVVAQKPVTPGYVQAYAASPNPRPGVGYGYAGGPKYYPGYKKAYSGPTYSYSQKPYIGSGGLGSLFD